MNLTAMLLAAVIVLPAFGLSLVTWWALARTEDELRQSAGFEDMQFDD